MKDVTQLKDYECGTTVKIGDKKYIILDQRTEKTLLLSEDIVEYMDMGGCMYYEDSNIRDFLNEEFYNEITNYVDESDILPLEVNLTAVDGTNEEAYLYDNISLLTLDMYRTYRKYIPAVDEDWWTSTKSSAEDDFVIYDFCTVNSSGSIEFIHSTTNCGVRPCFCINSDVVINDAEY